MKNTLSLNDRMVQYENVNRHVLIKKLPVIIRIDGRSFHTFTKNMNRPFDVRLADCMSITTQELVKEISGCYFGYTQSDEISLLLIDYMSINTDSWFDYVQRKLESISASLATIFFNRKFQELFPEVKNKWAGFDSRAFNLPRDEVVNYFIGRQLDATRNSVQMVGRANFSHKQLQNLSCEKIQDKLFKEKGINWNDTPTRFKRGTAVYKETCIYDTDIQKTIMRIDHEIPIFTQDRNFIQMWVDIDNGTSTCRI